MLRKLENKVIWLFATISAIAVTAELFQNYEDLDFENPWTIAAGIMIFIIDACILDRWADALVIGDSAPVRRWYGHHHR